MSDVNVHVRASTDVPPVVDASTEAIRKLRGETDKSSESTKSSAQATQAAASATKQFDTSMDGLNKRLHQALTPVRSFFRDLNSLMMMGGLALVINRISSEIGNLQKAYETANPEAAKAAGSLKNWTAAVEDMKAKAGGVVAMVLNPIRQAFIDLVDPMFRATEQLKNFSTWSDTVIKQYGSAGLAAQLKYTQALTDQAFAQQTLSDALGKQETLQRALAAAKAKLNVSEPSAYFGMAATGAALMQQQADKNYQVALTNVSKNSQIIAKAQQDLGILTDWLKANPPGGEGHVTTATLVADMVTAAVGGYMVPGIDLIRTRWQQMISDLLSGVDLLAQNAQDLQGILESAARVAQYNQPVAPVSGPTYGTYTGKPGTENPTLQFGQYSQGTPTGIEPAVAAAGETASAAVAATLAQALITLEQSVVSVGLLFNWLDTLLKPAIAIIGPLLDQALVPLVGILVTLGAQIGQVLTPVIQALSPIIKALGGAFVWLWNNVFMPVGNSIWLVLTWLGSLFWDFGHLIGNVIAAIQGKLAWGEVFTSGMMTLDLAELARHAPLTAIDYDKIIKEGEAAIKAANEAAGAGGGAGYSSQTTVQQPTYYTYITLSGTFIGDTKAAAGSAMLDCIREAIGGGARIEFMQN